MPCQPELYHPRLKPSHAQLFLLSQERGLGGLDPFLTLIYGKKTALGLKVEICQVRTQTTVLYKQVLCSQGVLFMS